MNKKLFKPFLFLFIALICLGTIYYLNFYNNEYHVHADFLVSINGEQINFSKSQFQSTSTQHLHENVHLHDNNGDVIHYHSRGISLQNFFTSLGMNLTNKCFSTLNNSYCSNQTHTLEVFVNNETIENPHKYVANDLDQIAIIYQNKNKVVEPILANLTDKACIESALCPSRGSPSEGSCVTGESCSVDLDNLE